MPTQGLENELRRALASAATAYPNPEQARQRLLQRDYRPGSGRRQLMRSITVAAAAGSVALGLGLSGVLGAAPLPSAGTIQTGAFTLTASADGTSDLTLKLTNSEMFDPAALQQALRRDGIPALVKTGTYCSSSPAAPDPMTIGVVTHERADGTALKPPSSPVVPPADIVAADTVTVINPAAMPAGTELFFSYFNSGHLLFDDLIYASSYTCGSQAPASS